MPEQGNTFVKHYSFGVALAKDKRKEKDEVKYD